MLAMHDRPECGISTSATALPHTLSTLSRTLGVGGGYGADGDAVSTILGCCTGPVCTLDLRDTSRCRRASHESSRWGCWCLKEWRSPSPRYMADDSRSWQPSLPWFLHLTVFLGHWTDPTDYHEFLSRNQCHLPILMAHLEDLPARGIAVAPSVHCPWEL